MRPFQGKSFFLLQNVGEKCRGYFFLRYLEGRIHTIGKICHTILGQFQSHEI